MEAETRDQKNVPENNGDPELETDSIPAEVSKQDHKDEEVSGLRRRKVSGWHYPNTKTHV